MLVFSNVTSLFTNIPSNPRIGVHLNEMFGISENTTISLNEFIEAEKFCLNAIFFRYNDSYNSQLFGTVMDSPISLTIANMVIEESEIQRLDYIPNFYKRYADDYIFCVPKNNYTLHAFNSFHL